MPFLSLEVPTVFLKTFGAPCRSYESLSKLGALTVNLLAIVIFYNTCVDTNGTK
jgi:hypothetical protein